MDSLDAVAARNPDKIVKVSNYAELIKAVHQHKIAAMLVEKNKKIRLAIAKKTIETLEGNTTGS